MIFIAADHAGYELKNKLIEHLESKGYQIEDCGAYQFDPNDDYPDFVGKAAQAVSKNPNEDRGIVIGGSGQAEAITANKFKNIRAALFYGKTDFVKVADINGRESADPYEIVRLSREHNDTNVLSLAARFLSEDEAKEAVDLWLSTKFDRASRHQRRHDKIAKIERKVQLSQNEVS